MTTATADLTNREDIVRLVDTFYDRVRADCILGPIFEDVAKVDWGAHLPKMYDFWDSVLFGRSAFKGNPMAVHIQLAGRIPLTGREFERWLELFHGSVDELFSGPGAEEAKLKASRIALVMHANIKAVHGQEPAFRLVRAGG